MDSHLAQNIPKGIQRTNITGEDLVNSKKYTSNKNTLNFGKPSAVKKVVLAARDNRKQKNISLLLNYLTVLWRWIVSFFNGLKDRKVTKDVFSTPLPPTCNRRILPMKPKIPILRGIQASEVMNYPLRRMLKCPVMKNEADGRRNDLQEIRKDCEDVDYRTDKGTPVFRNLTMTKFEKNFTAISKKRLHACGKMMDIVSHKIWLSRAKIDGDPNGRIFQKIAGQKLLLNFSEYKDVIEYISKQQRLGYWDIINQMACTKVV